MQTNNDKIVDYGFELWDLYELSSDRVKNWYKTK